MEFDLFSCTFENLNNLKFNELQKLSARFHVTKRWAKKREIIDNILLLRNQKIEENQLPADLKENNILQEKIEWIDGAKAFVKKGMDIINQNIESEDNDRRLTYCVNASDTEIEERRLTYKIERPDHLITNKTDCIDFGRLTYTADDFKCQNMNLKTTVSQNYDAIKDKEILQNPVDHNKNTQPKGEDKVNTDTNKLSVESKAESNMFSSLDQRKECMDLASSTLKRLTLPYTRISGHNNNNNNNNNNARIKIKDLKCNAAKSRENTSNVKRSIGRQPENMKSAQILQQKISLEAIKNNGVLKSSVIEKNESQISEKSSVNCSRDIKNELVTQGRSALPRRKSKTEDNVLVRNFKPSKNLMFYSPKESEIKNIRSFSKPNALNLELTCTSKIPRAKPSVSTQKPIVATKMPDFSKIHERRFQKMDSLTDYIRKKEERAKKLFGFPQPGIPLTASRNHAAKVFQFKSSNNEKENNLIKSSNLLKKDMPKNSKGSKEKSNRKDALSRAGSKPDIMMNLKEQNRKHLHGVRTNKRFELQMKSRKL